ncbi:MAG: FAD-dependent oxidoreductase [Arenicellales bacterium]|nr:FAD-dependent oxidoreductase [Arenicellales bacterium]
MATYDCDVLVIGGGIHGVGVAQAAAAAGYEVVVLEQNDLASGTSSRSSKLIHGGLRYLEGAQFSLVRESLHERELLLRLAPTLVKRQKFFIPIYPETSRRPWLMRLGLGVYALFSGMGPYARFRSIPKAEWEALDGLKTDRLQHVFQYWDAQTDDVLLTQAVMNSAQQLGARLLCPARFVTAEISPDSCLVSYTVNGQTKQCKCLTVVNAAGPWARHVATQFIPRIPDVAVDNVQGTHLELPGKVERGCYYMEVPQDKRAVFVMPWKNGTTLVGTTEHHYIGEPDAVVPLPEEREYLIDVYQHYFPNRSKEIINEWAGLRVLPAAGGTAFGRSRETQLPVDNESNPRVLSILGGKLTGYRATAEQVMHTLYRTLPKKEPIAQTSKIPLHSPELK